MIGRKTAVVVPLLLFFGPLAEPAAQGTGLGETDHGVRTIVTTDPELDDNNSLIRFLLYSNEIKVEGLVTASSGPHWKGDGQGTEFLPDYGEDRRFGLDLCPCTEWRWYDRHIEDVVDAYAQVFENLRQHDSRYPTPAELRRRVRVGNVEFEGDYSKESAGSNLIKEVLLDDRPGPVYLQAWGGPSTIARALLSIEETYADTDRWQEIYEKVSRKAIIISFFQQDKSYREYIAVRWPDVRLWQMATKTWGYGARDVVLPGNEVYLGAAWTKENVSAQGPLGSLYRVWGDGKQMVEGDPFDHFGFSGLTGSELRRRGYVVWTPVQEKGSWISEGDTSTFINLLQNGLRSYEHPAWGGWGGRAEQSTDDPSEWEGRSAVDYNDFNGARQDYAAARWFEDAQLDFAARLRWSVTSAYEDANHHPRAAATQVAIDARPGEIIRLRASATDPDGDNLEYHWWHYREAGTYPERISIVDRGSAKATLRVPGDALAGQTIHAILQVTDDGSPSLTSYQRVIIRVVE